MQLETLNKLFESINLKDGEVVYSEGEKSGDGYIIQLGNIKLKHVEHIPNKYPVLGPGEIFGVWKILFENEERFFTATAISNTRLIVIPEKFIEKELGNMDPFLRHCFKVWIPLREHFSA
jgi:CRP-like cAMP-binding protein